MTLVFRGQLKLGTRSSALALWQTDHVSERLRELSPGLDTRAMPLSTFGDREADAVLADLGGSAFSSEIDQALTERRIRVAVHSLKDLPIADNPGIVTAAILSREDPRDALVGAGEGGLAALPSGARVGTSSPRRAAQLRAARGDLIVEPVRGNVETRISKAVEGPLDAVVLAVAGLKRLGLTEHVRELLPLEDFLPAPGQGALAVQCRQDDKEARALLELIDDPAVRAEVDAERAFLAGLGGGCSLPVGALARHVEGGRLELRGFVGALNGDETLRVSATGVDPVELGRSLAEEALGLGARNLLA
jgi:hydroxymethylbilane synthase